ncbi:septal ring lytic transglycosylase RlpA family protein [Actimicrobium antarcticum]|uniref:Endolytic peptidoglycan transglycosylase RlpA n=1 Tax=Actimicrobium antarcticum TaxID=1051899 RepID=A0ABP7T658_9BURK
MQGKPPIHTVRRNMQHGLVLVAALALAACGSVPTAPPVPADTQRDAIPSTKKPAPAMPAAGSGRGGYYQDDGPGDNPPDNLLAVPDAEPKIEANFARNNKPYVVFGKTYTPTSIDTPLKQRGIASWYGKKFHGQKTASGELYDMYKMTGAHPTMPLPSYVRVTNLANGKQVIVRINDRGPFHSSRIMDLSYTAALKLGYLGKGSSEIEIERLLPDEIARMEKDRLGERALPLMETARRPAAMPVLAALDVKMLPVMATTTVAANSATGAGPAASAEGAVIPPAMTSGTSLMMDLPAEATVTSAPQDAAALMPATSAAPASAGTPGFYVQLGAFSQAPNAEAARLRLQRDLQRDAADALPPAEVVQTGAVFRLYSGPFSSRTEAEKAAQKVLSAGGAKPFIVQR